MMGPGLAGEVDVSRVKKRMRQEKRRKKRGPVDRSGEKMVRLGRRPVPEEAVGSSSESRSEDDYSCSDHDDNDGKNVADGVGRSAKDSLVQQAHLPSPPSESEREKRSEDFIGVPVNKITFVQQAEVWTCCSCSEDRNPVSALACRTALCGHVRGELCCGRRWVD